MPTKKSLMYYTKLRPRTSPNKKISQHKSNKFKVLKKKSKMMMASQLLRVKLW